MTLPDWIRAGKDGTMLIDTDLMPDDLTFAVTHEPENDCPDPFCLGADAGTVEYEPEPDEPGFWVRTGACVSVHRTELHDMLAQPGHRLQPHADNLPACTGPVPYGCERVAAACDWLDLSFNQYAIDLDLIPDDAILEVRHDHRLSCKDEDCPYAPHHVKDASTPDMMTATIRDTTEGRTIILSPKGGRGHVVTTGVDGFLRYLGYPAVAVTGIIRANDPLFDDDPGRLGHLRVTPYTTGFTVKGVPDWDAGPGDHRWFSVLDGRSELYDPPIERLLGRAMLAAELHTDIPWHAFAREILRTAYRKGYAKGARDGIYDYSRACGIPTDMAAMNANDAKTEVTMRADSGDLDYCDKGSVIHVNGRRIMLDKATISHARLYLDRPDLDTPYDDWDGDDDTV